MQHHRSVLIALLAGALPLGLGSTAMASDLQLIEVQTGFGRLLPHTIEALDDQGHPSGSTIEVRTLEDLISNVTRTNGVHATPGLPTSAVLPGGHAGNQFLAVRFDRGIDLRSVISADAGSPGLLPGSIQVRAVDANTGQSVPVEGRAFVGGQTFGASTSSDSAELTLQTWVHASDESPVANGDIDNDGNGVPDGLGFPGTQASFAAAGKLLDSNVFVFVPDTDGDLTTHETFPAGVEIVVEVGLALRDVTGASLATEARTSTRLGEDQTAPGVRVVGGSHGLTPEVTPRHGETSVDPRSTITIGFTEPVHFAALAEVTDSPFSWGGESGLQLRVGQGSTGFGIPYTVLPVSAYDLSTLVLTPKFPFPGASRTGQRGPELNRVALEVLDGGVMDLANNKNATGTSSAFTTGVGQGVTNAPVAPDAIYAGVTGQQAALSVIDLNGFGQGTGNPTYDPQNQTVEGNTNFPNNPNFKLQGLLLRPPLSQGTSSVDGGSAGVFTRTLDSNLDPNLAQSPALLDVSDMALGAPLDLAFNNGPAPFGCQSGGGNLCASTNLMQTKVSLPVTSGFTVPYDGTVPPINTGVGVGNTIAWAPHPNPPPLIFPPLCVSPFIGSQEPTSAYTGMAPPAGLGLTNLLVPGDPFGDPSMGIPPSGLLAWQQNGFFQGPREPQSSIGGCTQYMMRQQVGHFLYVVDRERKELVVLNSNRMAVIERISLPDPARLAVGPHMELLAVTNRQPGTVSFIDITPNSATFHTVVQTTQVGDGPLGIAWDSLNEDILVCNERSNDVSIISAFSLQVRKVVSLPGMRRPFEVVITPRQMNFGFQRNVYFGYVASRDGRISIFESGPNGVGGWGFDDMIGSLPYRFHKPKALAVAVDLLNSGVYVAHEGAIDLQTQQATPPGTGAISLVGIESAIVGQQILGVGQTPSFRDMNFRVHLSLGEHNGGDLTGIPVDLALDNQLNLGSLPGVIGPFSAGLPADFNSKCLIRDAVSPRPVSRPQHLFASVPSSSQGGGAVDVIAHGAVPSVRVDTNPFQPGTQSVPMPGVGVLADYFRQ